MKAIDTDRQSYPGLLLLACMLIAPPCTAGTGKADDLRRAFAHHYALWKAHCQGVTYSSQIEDRLRSPDFEAIVRLGPAILPYIFEKVDEDEGFVWIGWAWGAVTRVSIDPSVNPWAKEPIENWWQGGKSQARTRFESAYTRWRDLKRQGRSQEASRARENIRALGISCLPMIMAGLDTDSEEMLALVEDITGGTADTSGRTTVERVKSCLSWWARNREAWLIPFPNTQPVALAGQDQTVVSGATVVLDGSGSTDSDKDSLTYEWRQIAGPVVDLSGTTAPKATFTAPQINGPTTLVFQLIVNDGSPQEEVHPVSQSGRSKPALVRVIVKPGG